MDRVIAVLLFTVGMFMPGLHSLTYTCHHINYTRLILLLLIYLSHFCALSIVPSFISITTFRRILSPKIETSSIGSNRVSRFNLKTERGSSHRNDVLNTIQDDEMSKIIIKTKAIPVTSSGGNICFL
jgi:hypothetical protein